MKTSTKYSVSDAATLYKKSRATLYKDIKNGVLSRDHDGFIDFSELLRVYGEPFSGKQSKRIDTSPIQNPDTSEYTDKTVIELKNQIDFLKKQLEKAEDRESKANARIDTLLTLIEMKPSKANFESDKTHIKDDSPSGTEDITTNLQSESPKEDGLTTVNVDKKHITVPEHVEPEPKKRSFWSRFFLPYG
ncbi:TPA: DNA-binding protein [Acinetobacter baumannii]|uniref:plasmid replication DNA-binding protein n=1 Tax=Acinetobacter baumannii TaxID=470 RepID=UPI0023411268|nr:plasmid replication DNA-binding protein [Acinetobacter baumannii]HEN9525250.1 DNA-binding protein [Acinetobacter baumannii]HEN9532990.1 DNA-binding protein [Acinetobacter baumannii]HEN9568325.1 DNA-binding protein [Acinetobacter baumannii]HEN9572567.1 DNA-binding protein [Acinetobacter baumannii]